MLSYQIRLSLYTGFTLILLWPQLIVQGQTSFQKVYHGFNPGSQLTDLTTDNNGNMIMAACNSDGVTLSKTTCAGDYLYSHQIVSGGEVNDARSIELSNGDLIFSFTSGNAGLNTQDVILARISSNGNLIWSKKFGGNLNDILGDFLISSDGNITLTGTTFSYGADAVSGSMSDVFILRMSANGNYISSHVYGVAGLSESATTLTETADGSLLVSGQSSSGGLSKIFLLKQLSDNTLEYFSVIGQDNHFNLPTDIMVGTTGEIFITGSSTEMGSDISSTPTPVIWKADMNSGSALSAWFYASSDGGNGSAISIEPTTNNKMLVSILSAGYSTYDTDPSPQKIGFLRIDADGSPLSGRIVTTGGSSGGYIESMNDGTSLIYGNCSLFSGTAEPVAFKLNTFFTSGCNENDILNLTSFNSAWIPESNLMTPFAGAASNPVDISINASGGVIPSVETLCTDPGNLEAAFLGWGGCLGTNLPFEDISEGSIVSWSWDFGDGTVVPYQHPAHMYADTGNYIVTLTISDGCSLVSDSMEILIEDAPVADAGPDQTIRPEESVVIGIPADNPTWEYQWSPGGTLDNNQIPQPVASPTVSTTYVLTVSSANGCSVMDMVTVYVDMTPLIPDQTGQLYVPNIFSPNDDGENDVLYVYGGPFTNFNLVIFNRLGERVFSSTNQEVGWDGRFRGNPAPIGAYYYSLTLTDKDMQTISSGGNITLTR